LALRSTNLILHSSFTANPDAAFAFFKKDSQLKGMKMKMKKIVIDCSFTSPLAKANKEETTYSTKMLT
jgi:hypothetical protein